MMKKEKGLFEIIGFETSAAILAAGKDSRRPLVRIILRAGGALSDEELSLVNSLPESEREMVKADLLSLKGTRYTQLVTLDDLRVDYPKPPALTGVGDSDATALAEWDYYTPSVQTVLATKKHMICTAYTAAISELLADTPFANGVSETGEPIAITGVTDTETKRVYSTHSRVYFGIVEDDNTAFQTLKNGLLRNISEGDEILGANDAETAAMQRKLANPT